MFARRERIDYAEKIATSALEWRRKLDAISAQAEDVRPDNLKSARTLVIEDGWKRLIQAKDDPLSAISENTDLAEELIRLTLIADEASRGIGVTWNNQIESGRGD